MTGGWIEQYPDDVKAIAAAGHELGNHSENHKQMSTLSSEECKKELMTPHEKVKKLTGIDMKVFRPPYGDYNDTLITTVRECGYSPIQWDVDSLDWKDYDAATITQRVTSAMHCDVIFVMDGGALVDSGTHAKLLERCGVYREIYASQTLSLIHISDPRD